MPKLYLVGGAVRDMLLRRPQKDRDYLYVGAAEDDVMKSRRCRSSQTATPSTLCVWRLSRKNYSDVEVGLAESDAVIRDHLKACVDVVVTDRPVLLSAVYTALYSPQSVRHGVVRTPPRRSAAATTPPLRRAGPLRGRGAGCFGRRRDRERRAGSTLTTASSATGTASSTLACI